MLPLLKSTCLEPVFCNKKSLRTTMKNGPCLPRLKRAHTQQQGSRATKSKYINNFFKCSHGHPEGETCHSTGESGDAFKAEGVPGLTQDWEKNLRWRRQLEQRWGNQRTSGRSSNFTDRIESSREGLQCNFKFRASQRFSINNLVGHVVWKGYLKY